MRVKIFADGAELSKIIAHNENPLVKGFTTNPTLMRKAGMNDYPWFAKEMLQIVGNKPVSFEVFGDSEKEFLDQADTIASWGKNVYVKIPAMYTNGDETHNAVRVLVENGIKVNVTAVFTENQVREFSNIIGNRPSYISVFAGRIADAGKDPVLSMCYAQAYMETNAPKQELIWASPRQVYDVVLADRWKVDIITVTDEILKKIPLIGKDLEQFSLETCQMFYNDAQASGFTI